MKRLGTTLLLILLALPAWAARHALLIGNWDYDENGLFQPLRQPKNDLAAMQKLLKEKGRGFRITVIKNARRSELMRRFNRFLESLHKGDTVLFYYSGHGAQIGNSDYLIPVGAPFYSIAEVIDRDQGAVSLNIMVERIQEKIGDGGVQVALLDACRNDLTKGGGGAGLGSINAAGVLVAYAASPGKRAWATGPKGMSPFTYYLVEALKQNASQKIQEVLEETAKAVRHYTRKYQWPWQAGNLMGEFCLAPPCGRGETRLANAGKTTRVKHPARVPEPRMVSIKGGCFRMGQRPEDKAWLIDRIGKEKYENYYSDETPYTACVDDFQLAEHEVTVREFTRFVRASGYVTDAEKNPDKGCWAYSKNNGWGWRAGRSWRNPNPEQPNRMDHPVSCVSYNDAQAYVDWLAKETGQPYRLPTEAEFAYALRAGSQTRFPWGDEVDERACGYANVADETTYKGRSWSDPVFPCKDGYFFTAPVKQFKPNAWGLYDLSGNLWEWTCSAYTSKLGSEAERCSREKDAKRVLRGGSWSHDPRFLRSADRSWDNPVDRDCNVGFRVARPPP